MKIVSGANHNGHGNIPRMVQRGSYAIVRVFSKSLLKQGTSILVVVKPKKGMIVTTQLGHFKG